MQREFSLEAQLGAGRAAEADRRSHPYGRRLPREILTTGPRPHRILVVDDNPATRRFVREALELDGFEVVEADGGGAAIEACAFSPPDLVIIDLCMSDMRGTDVIRRLRQDSGTAELPIVVFTGAPEEIGDDEACGFSDLLTKPSDPEALVQTVRSLLEAPAAGEEHTQEPPATPTPSRPRVLLVDADTARAARMRIHLHRLGCDVMLVPTGAQALRSARAFRPAVVVAGLVLPDTTALELTRDMRSDPGFGDVPVILTSPAPWSEVQHRLAERAGATAFVNIGSDLTSLRDAVLEAVDAPFPTPAPAPALDARPAHDDEHLIRELDEQYRRQIDAERSRERGQAELSVLQGLAEALGDSADLDLVLHSALARCLHAVGASRGAVFLGEIDGGFTMRAHVGDLGRLPGARVPATEDLFARVTGTGETLVVDGDPDGDATALRRASTVVAPLTGGSEHYGVLVVEVPAHEDLAYWVHFLKLVGLALGFALANVRKRPAAMPAAPATRSSADGRDALTGVADATTLERDLEALLENRGATGCLLVIDVDRIRHVNDALGHRTGDELLCGIARALEPLAGRAGTLARLHSDVFALLVPGGGHVEHGTGLARKVMAALEAPIRCNGYTLYATVSIGIAAFPEHARRAGSLLQHATTALDVAKERGGNTSEVYAQDRSDTLWRRLTLDQGLRAALERNQFSLHYQPIIDLATGGVAAAEALLRWERPLHGTTPAADFIQVAEETGLIIPIGAWVLRDAARQAREWADAGLHLDRLAVNVGAREFHDGRIYETVAAALDETGVDPHRLSIEITETVALADLDAVVATLERIRGLGVQIALDDFGAGYSSLRYVQVLPIDTLKIDRSFVADAVRSERSEPILAGIIEMAHRLGMRVVAEGIETDACLELVRSLGCDEAQGYHLGRPGPAGELETRLPPR